MSPVFRYDPGEILLAARAAHAILGAHIQLRLRSIEVMRSWATQEATHNCPRDELLVAFRRASARLPGSCLVRALALQRFLADHGHCSELRIGVARSEAGLMAHAWLVEGKQILVGDGEEAATFTVLASWPHAGSSERGLISIMSFVAQILTGRHSQDSGTVASKFEDGRDELSLGDMFQADCVVFRRWLSSHSFG